MEKIISEINGSLREVEFILSQSDLQPHFDKAYKDAIPHIDMKGFRKGKVPMNMVKKFYGKKIELDALENISNDTFQNFIKEDEVPVIGTPHLIDISPIDTGWSFKIQYEIIPALELNEYKGLSIIEPVHPVSDEEIDAEIESLARNNGDLVDADQVTDDLHIVDVSINEIDDSTNVPIIGQKPQETKIFLADEYVLPEMKANLMNTKNGDNFTFRPNQFDPHAPDKTYRITVKAIKKLVPKEITDNFVNEYSQGKFNTVDELKEEIGFQMQEKWDEKSRNEMENQLVSQLVDMHDFDVPESVVQDVIVAMGKDIKKRYADVPNADKLDIESMAEGLRPLAERTVKWEIIRNKIIQIENLEIEDHDIEEIVNLEVQRIGGDPNTLRTKLKQNKQFTDNLLSKKVIELLIDFAITEEMPFNQYEEEHGHDHDHHDHDHDHHDHDHDHHDHDHDHHDHDHDHHDHDHDHHGHGENKL